MSSILKRFLLVSSFYLLAPTAGALDLEEAMSSGAQALSSAAEVSGEAQSLIGQLQDQLGVTETQAVGGTGALLRMAQNQLGESIMNGVTSEVSGLSGLLGKGGDGSLTGALLSNISSLDGVQQAFGTMGLDAGMVQQFVPIVLGFLGNQGVGSELLGQLGSLWTPSAG